MPLWLVSQSFLAGEWRLRDVTKWRVGCHITSLYSSVSIAAVPTGVTQRSPSQVGSEFIFFLSFLIYGPRINKGSTLWARVMDFSFYFRSLLSEHPMCNNWHLTMKFVVNLQLINQNTVRPLSWKLAAFSVPCSSLSVSGEDRRRTQTPLVARPLFPASPPTEILERPASQAIS